jgi:hypothetical protein
MSSKPLAPGMLVLVVHTTDPSYAFLVGQTGTIICAIRGPAALLTSADWIVELPGTAGTPCPHCGKTHTIPRWPMQSCELRPIEDPDPPFEEQTDLELSPSLEETTT